MTHIISQELNSQYFWGRIQKTSRDENHDMFTFCALLYGLLEPGGK